MLFTLVKVHPGKKYSTMVIDATITKTNTHTTMVRAEGREHDLRTKGVAEENYCAVLSLDRSHKYITH